MTVSAFARGGSGRYSYNWAYYPLVGGFAGIREIGPGRSFDLSGDSGRIAASSKRGANVVADGAVTFSVWAPRGSVSERVLDPAARAARRAADDPRAGRGLRGRADAATAPAGSDYVYLLRRRRAPRPGLALPAARRARAVAHRRPGGLRVDRRRLARAAARASSSSTSCTSARSRPRGRSTRRRRALPHLRELGVTAIELMPVAEFPGDAQLGLRRRLPVRAADELRRAGRAEAARRRLPRARARAVPRRRLQPPRPGRELPRRVRAVLHRPLPDALGRRAQLRRRRTATRCAASSSTTRSTG